MRFALIAALCLSTLVAQPKPKATLDKVAMEAYIRHLLAVMPEVQVKIDDPIASPIPELQQVEVHFTFGDRTQDETYYVSKDGKEFIRGNVYVLNQNPFKADLDKLKTTGAPSFGTPGAPVTLVLFSDFECPLCKDEAKTLRQNLLTTFPTQVRVYFKDFPIEQIHPWAKAAAIAGRCIYSENPAAFWTYFDWVYDHQSEITPENVKDQLLRFAGSDKEIDGMQFGRCIDTKATEPEINTGLAEVKALKIDATPTMFVNGRRLVGSYPWQNLEQIINGELNYQKTAHKADDKCCEIKIPSALNK